MMEIFDIAVGLIGLFSQMKLMSVGANVTKWAWISCGCFGFLVGRIIGGLLC